MLWCSFIEIDALLSIIMVIMYGLYSLKAKSLYLNDVYVFCRLFPVLFVVGFWLDGCQGNMTPGIDGMIATDLNSMISFDLLLALLLFFIMYSFKSFESVLLLLFAFIGQYYMLHSVDLLSFYIALEAQNFCFLVLCGLPTFNTLNNVSSGCSNHSFSVEASLKYFLLSAFSSGVILFWFSILYLQTGNSSIQFLCMDDGLDSSFGTGSYNIYSYEILCAMMFKLGAAPLHLWVVQIYNGVKRQLLMFISTAPKLCLFGFWINSFHGVWTDYSLLFFSLFSLVLGSFGAYSQPGLRSLFAYSTVNEIGLMLSALEVAGFHNLMQHFGIYIITQFLLWHIEDKRLFSVIAVSLAGLPPLAGFFGKTWILWGLSTAASGSGDYEAFGPSSHSTGLYVLLLTALCCTVLSLVYYLRVLRLFFNTGNYVSTPAGQQGANGVQIHTRLVQYNNARAIPSMLNTDIPGFVQYDSRIFLTSACAIALFVMPFFLIKPFVL